MPDEGKLVVTQHPVPPPFGAGFFHLRSRNTLDDPALQAPVKQLTKDGQHAVRSDALTLVNDAVEK